jgi:triacylglycerol lipase
MVTYIARLLILFQIAVAIGVFIWITRVGHVQNVALAVLASIGAVLLLRILITANSFFAAWLYRSETPAERSLGWSEFFQLFREEFSATMLSSSWSMAFHAFDKRPAKYPEGLPVLLIHGYGCNSGYWHAMSKALTSAHVTHHAVNLEPIFGDIDEYVPTIQRAIETLCAETGQPKIIIVAHSMGGLVSRAYLRRHGSERIAKVITLGTPHRGTGLANFGIGENSRQMRWRGDVENGVISDWLRQLEETEDHSVYKLFVSIYSHHDNIVSPQTSSYLAGARHIEFHGVGHVALGLNRAVQAKVLEEILNVETQ